MEQLMSQLTEEQKHDLYTSIGSALFPTIKLLDKLKIEHNCA